MSNIPLLIQGIGLVLVTLLIPIWLSLFRSEKTFKNLDEKVLVNHILRGKFLLLILGFIFIPPLLWVIPHKGLKFLILIISGCALFYLFKSLRNALEWISGRKSKLRFDFLDSLKDFKDTEEIWRSVWENKNIDKEKEYLSRFFNKLKILIFDEKQEHVSILNDYLKDFKNNIENRNLVNILYEGQFSNILDWYYDSWLEKKELFKERNKYPDWRYEKNFVIYKGFRDIFERIEKISLKEYSITLHYFMDEFKKKVEKWDINEEIPVDFLKDLYGYFLEVLFEETKDDKMRYFIWELNFPYKWEITYENLKVKSKIPKITWEKYFIWAFNRFQTPYNSFDLNLTFVTEQLFPEVNYLIWSKILIFNFTGVRDIKERLYYTINREWSFAPIPQVKVSFKSEEGEEKNLKEFEKEFKNTYNLALKLFPHDFNKKSLTDYIKTLDELEDKFIDIKEERRKSYKTIFSEMKKFIEK